MFVDEAKVYVRSGKGGDGMVHFTARSMLTGAGRMAVMVVVGEMYSWKFRTTLIPW